MTRTLNYSASTAPVIRLIGVTKHYKVGVEHIRAWTG